jgi:hypothetical protein
MNKIAATTFAACVLIWTASLFFADRLPQSSEILPELIKEPLQEPVYLPPFTVTKNNITYTITPVFSYRISGLLVTQHNSKSWIDMSHEDWKDFINVKDISLIWGQNLETNDFRRVSYSHGDWTGYYSYRGDVKFDGRCFSNNHLIPANDTIAKTIIGARVGDQVRIKGQLANYARNNSEFHRNTSATRDDSGNGACEIIYVTEFTILNEANPIWRELQRLSFFAALLCLAYLIFRIFTQPL